MSHTAQDLKIPLKTNGVGVIANILAYTCAPLVRTPLIVIAIEFALYCSGKVAFHVSRPRVNHESRVEAVNCKL